MVTVVCGFHRCWDDGVACKADTGIVHNTFLQDIPSVKTPSRGLQALQVSIIILHTLQDCGTIAAYQSFSWLSIL